ncbi:unnamed protein product, partial [Ectocarpus sp. 13 AM-2016]
MPRPRRTPQRRRTGWWRAASTSQGVPSMTLASPERLLHPTGPRSPTAAAPTAPGQHASLRTLGRRPHRNRRRRTRRSPARKTPKGYPPPPATERRPSQSPTVSPVCRSPSRPSSASAWAPQAAASAAKTPTGWAGKEPASPAAAPGRTRPPRR